LVQFYNEVAEHMISPNAVVVHEALLHLKWLAEAAEAKAKNDFGRHDQRIMQIFWEGFYGELVWANEEEGQIRDRSS
jgi:hypothetical protein